MHKLNDKALSHLRLLQADAQRANERISSFLTGVAAGLDLDLEATEFNPQLGAFVEKTKPAALLHAVPDVVEEAQPPTK
jgi:hypothetical protein